MPSDKKVYPPVGRCIYCGAENVKMTDEHIIPFGLGGTWILPKSSCQACATITGKFEQFCLRSMFGNARIRLNFPTRRPKERPDKLPVEFVRKDGAIGHITLSAQEIPLVHMGYKFPAPGIIRDANPTDGFEGELIVKIADENTFMQEKQKGHHFKIGSIHMDNFARMLAKIAHSYTVAEFGQNAFYPLLPNLILGKTSLASYLVGGDKSDTPLLDTEPFTHNVYRQDCLTNGIEYILIAIRLFAFAGMPRYHVVVGEKRI